MSVKASIDLDFHEVDQMQPRGSQSTRTESLAGQKPERMELTMIQKELYRDEAQVTLAHAVRSMRKIQANPSEYLADWKHYKSKHDLDVYTIRRRKKESPPVFMAYGNVQGNMEDLIIAEHTEVDEKLQHKNKHVDGGDFEEASVVHTIDTKKDTHGTNGTFRYLGIKLASGSRSLRGIKWIVKPRDWLFWESTGITLLSDPKDPSAAPIRLGYEIIRPCELLDIPPSSVVMRGRLGYFSLYYQVSPGTIRVFSQCSVDFAGEVSSEKPSSAMALRFVLRVFLLVRYAESKQLTEFSHEYGHESVSLSATNRSSFFETKESSSSQCRLCQRLVRSTLQKITNSIKPCYICNLPICSKCRVYKSIVTKEGWKNIRCCQQCLLSSKMVLSASANSRNNSAELYDLHGTSMNASVSDLSCNVISSSEVSENSISSLQLGKTTFDFGKPDWHHADVSTGDKQYRSQTKTTLYDNLPSDKCALESSAPAPCSNLNSWKLSSHYHSIRARCRTSSITEDSQVSMDGFEDRDGSYSRTSTSQYEAVRNDHQRQLYQKMIALQYAADTAYKTTQINQMNLWLEQSNSSIDE